MEINEGALDGIADFLARRWKHFREHYLGYMLWTAIIILVSTCTVNIKPAVKYSHLYVDGTIVCMKLTNQRTQVVDHYDFKGRIEVRYATTRVVTDDGLSTSVEGYDTMWIDEYEVEKCEK